MTSEQYLGLYYMESEAIARGFSVNSEELMRKMPLIYSEEVFKKMIEHDLKVLRELENEKSDEMGEDGKVSDDEMSNEMKEKESEKEENDEKEGKNDETDDKQERKMNNLSDPETNRKIYIVGDIHGSVIQLFTPLIKARIIRNLRYSFDEDQFEFDFYKNVDKNTRIIYTGDIIYRGIHAHLMAMIEALILVIQRFNYKIVNWVFGNHDMEFVKYGGVPRYTLSEYARACPRFHELHSLFCDFALKNPYKFGYSLEVNAFEDFKSELQAPVDTRISPLKVGNESQDKIESSSPNDIALSSHKVGDESQVPILKGIGRLSPHISESQVPILKGIGRLSPPKNKPDIDIELPLDMFTSNRILVTHTVQSKDEIESFIKQYNETFQTNLNLENLDLKEMNKCFDNIVKLMLKSPEKYYTNKSVYGPMLFNTLWDRPAASVRYVDYGYKYHFIGHTPVENIKFIVHSDPDLRSNLMSPTSVIVITDLNTYNNENEDECAFFELTNFKMNIHENEDTCHQQALTMVLPISHHVSHKFDDFTMKIVKNHVKYHDLLSETDVSHINEGIAIYTDLFDISE